MDANVLMEKIESARKRLEFFVRARRALRLLAIGAGALLLIAAFSRVFPFPLLGAAIPAVAAIAFITAFVYAYLGRVTLTEGALVLDTRLGLSERLSTAAELFEKNRASEGGMAGKLFEDAAEKSKNIDVRSAIPFHAPGEGTIFLALTLATVVILAIPPVYANAGTVESVYRVSISLEKNLNELGASITAKTGDTSDLKKDLAAAGEELKRDPKAGLTALIGLSKRAGKINGEKNESAAAVKEMEKGGPLADLANRIENRSDPSDAVKKAGEITGGAGEEQAEMKAAVLAVKAALASDSDLRKMVDSLLDALEKKNREEFERKLSEFADALSKKMAVPDMRQFKERLDADAAKLAAAIGSGTGTLEPGGQRTLNPSTAKGEIETEYSGGNALAQEDMELKIQNARVPERYRDVVVRYFEKSR